MPAEETGSIPEKTTAAEPAEGDVPPEPPKWKKVLQTAKKVVLKLPYPYLIMRIVGCYFMVMAAFLLINRKEIRGGSLNPVEKWEEFVDKLPLLPVLPEDCFLQSQSAGQWVLCCSGVGLGAGVSFS